MAGAFAHAQIRGQAVERLSAESENQRQQAAAFALAHGLSLREEHADGTVRELMGVSESGEPLFLTTMNRDAAISIGADILQAAPYSLDGAGLTIGMWDGGAGRISHQEFQGRMFNINGAGAITHATHVGGTLIAAGIDPRARGMAPAALVDSYDWNDDLAEMTAAAAALPNEPGKIALSNHSYGFIRGWQFDGGKGGFVWYGPAGANASGFDPNFGAYNFRAALNDGLVYNAPYFLPFWAAGNDRSDNPATGNPVFLTPSATTSVAYDPALHPPGDAVYRNGFRTISDDGIAKNVVTVGAVTEAVVNGLRDPSVANMTGFSSWGPTDDGRIKPDVVAKGAGVFSPSAGSNSSYATLNGTSMASPNAAGGAALLLQQYGTLFPGNAPLASTLKGLLIHTADDLGNPGPDYRFGWGLVNVEAAANHIAAQAADPASPRMLEDTITSGDGSVFYEFAWDGFSPIRATLVWTDPPANPASVAEDRTPRLVNDLDLHIEDPEGNRHDPWVMPFVGTWTVESMNLPATRGRNATDNVEQVLIEDPSLPGIYRAVVSHTGPLTNSAQTYSLLISGVSGEALPLSLTSIAPAKGLSGDTVQILFRGTGFSAESVFRLTHPALADLTGSDVIFSGLGATVSFDLSGQPPAIWTAEVQNNDADAVTLKGAFEVRFPVFAENFEAIQPGWITESEIASNDWFLITGLAQSPPISVYVEGIATRSLTNLYSPVFAIPAGATNLRLSFWQWRGFNGNNHAGKLEYTLDGQNWTDVAASGSGVTFLQNGYNGTVNNTGGNPNNRNPFQGQSAWVNSTSSFEESILQFDPAIFGGQTVAFRWRHATNQGTAATGWVIDSILFLADNIFPDPLPVALSITPPTATLFYDGEIQFAAAVTDQYAEPFDPAPGEIIWSASGSNTISANGLFLADTVGGPFTIEATLGSLTATATVDVDPAPATVILTDLLQAFDGSPKPVSVTTEPAGLSVDVLYDGLAHPPSEVGIYSIVATITDARYVGSVSDNLEIFALATTGDPLETWIAEFFPDAADPEDPIDPRVDHNGSGWATLADLAFGNDPSVLANERFVPAVESTLAEDVFTYPLTLRAFEVLSVEVVYTHDLVNWNPVESVPGADVQHVPGGFREGGESVEQVDRITIRLPRFPGLPRLFRIDLTYDPHGS